MKKYALSILMVGIVVVSMSGCGMEINKYYSDILYEEESSTVTESLEETEDVITSNQDEKVIASKNEMKTTVPKEDVTTQKQSPSKVTQSSTTEPQATKTKAQATTTKAVATTKAPVTTTETSAETTTKVTTTVKCYTMEDMQLIKEYCKNNCGKYGLVYDERAAGKADTSVFSMVASRSNYDIDCYKDQPVNLQWCYSEVDRILADVSGEKLGLIEDPNCVVVKIKSKGDYYEVSLWFGLYV